MTTALLALLALALQQPADRDVVHLKDGTERSGFIVSEEGDRVELELLMKGSKGEINGLVKVAINKADIGRIERVPGEIRERVRERAKWFAGRRKRQAEALAKVRPVAVTLRGAPGLRTAGSFFEIDSTCDEAFLKQATVGIEEVFAAYQKHFDIQRNRDKKVKIHLLASAEEYRAVQKELNKIVLENPALYLPAHDCILAHNMIEKEKAAKVREEILSMEKEIEAYKARITGESKRIAQYVRETRKKILDESARAKTSALRAGGGKRVSEVERWKKENLKKLSDWQKGAEKQLKEYRAKANAAIASNHKIISQNQGVLKEQNQKMFEMLYHEAFHAFTHNFLWELPPDRGVPRWLEEGMACYFEMSAVERGDLLHGAVHPDHVKTLKEAKEAGALSSLESLLRADVKEFLILDRTTTDASRRRYAQSWLLVHYLMGRVKKAQLKAYVDGVLAGADPLAAFEKLAGQTCAEAEAGMLRHLDKLP